MKHPVPNNDSILMPGWLAELERLAQRYPETGVLHDLPNLDFDELWGAFQFLRHIHETHGQKDGNHG